VNAGGEAIKACVAEVVRLRDVVKRGRLKSHDFSYEHAESSTNKALANFK
jgi:hypothetical protein